MTEPTACDIVYYMAGDTMISFRLPSDVLTALEKAAKDEDRSRSSWCLRVLREKLIRQGYLPAIQTPRAKERER